LELEKTLQINLKTTTKPKIMTTISNYQNRLQINNTKGNLWNMKRRYR